MFYNVNCRPRNAHSVCSSSFINKFGVCGKLFAFWGDIGTERLMNKFNHKTFLT